MDELIVKLLDAIMKVVHDDVTIPWKTKVQMILDKAETEEIWDSTLDEFLSWFEDDDRDSGSEPI